jgi:hypothetical protein
MRKVATCLLAPSRMAGVGQELNYTKIRGCPTNADPSFSNGRHNEQKKACNREKSEAGHDLAYLLNVIGLLSASD